MKQKRVFVGVMGLALLPLAASAQIHQDVSNSTATVVRDPARQASTDVDAVLFNPAGTVFLDNGWHLSLNGKLAYQNFNLGDNRNSIEKSMVDHIPSLQAAYKTGAWAFSFSIGNEGGYGAWASSEDAYLTNTLTNFHKQLFDLYKEAMRPYANSCSLFDQLDSKVMVSGNLYNYSVRVGAAYQINSHLSASVGLRLNYVTEKTKVNLLNRVLTTNGSVESPNDYFSAVNDEFQQSMQKIRDEASIPEEELNAIINGALGDYVNQEMAKTPDFKSLIDERTNGWGITPVIGVDYNINNFNFAAKYEFETKIHPQGSALSYHLPGVFSLGASWQVTDDFQVAVGGNLHHQKSNSMYGREQSIVYPVLSESGSSKFYQRNDGGVASGDFSASVSFSPIKRLLFSVGYTCAYQAPMYKSFYSQSIASAIDNNSYPATHIVSGGLRYEINDKVQFDFGVSHKASVGERHDTFNSLDNYRGMSMSAGINVNL